MHSCKTIFCRLNGPTDVSRFDPNVTSDTRDSGKTVNADFRFEFVDDSDSGEGCDDDDAGYVDGFNYVDPKLVPAGNVETSKSGDPKNRT
jgi:hypothetical protein